MGGNGVLLQQRTSIIPRVGLERLECANDTCTLIYTNLNLRTRCLMLQFWASKLDQQPTSCSLGHSMFLESSKTTHIIHIKASNEQEHRLLIASEQAGGFCMLLKVSLLSKVYISLYTDIQDTDQSNSHLKGVCKG